MAFQLGAFQVPGFQQTAGAALIGRGAPPMMLDEELFLAPKKKRRKEDRVKLLAEEDEFIMRAIVEFLNHANK